MTREQTEFEDFFRTQRRPLLAKLRFAGATPSEAEEIAQAAFVDALVRWEQISNPNAWLRTVAMRRFIKMRTRSRMGTLREAQAFGTHSEVDTAADRDLTVLEDQQWVEQMVQSLPPTQRTVMALVFDGHRPTEIAGILGKNEANIRQNLKHAREHLRRVLKRDAWEDCAKRRGTLQKNMDQP